MSNIKYIDVKIKLQGWFPDIYDDHKPKGMSDESYINAMISSWLMKHDDENPITDKSGITKTRKCE